MKIFEKDKPIITSLLETDTYKIHMLYFIWTFFPYLKTKFSFKNRTTSVLLAKKINLKELKEQLNFARCLKFTQQEINWLKEKENFSPEFLNFLKNDFKLSEIEIKNVNGQLQIETAEDYWVNTTLWELIVLPIVNELYARQYAAENIILEREIIDIGEARLRGKIKYLDGWPIKIMQFGLRRRLSKNWEKHITQMIIDLNPKLMTAISNLQLAKELNFPYGGTNAHELPMAINACRWIEGAEKAYWAPYETFIKWFQLYPQQKIILPDTFGSKQFFNDIPSFLAQEATGFRQDSGDPRKFASLVIKMCKKFNLNTKTKTIIFSDSLNKEKILSLFKEFSPLFNLSFGWGTNLTNDTPVKPLSLVMKLTRAGGIPAVKLSDNLNKFVGEKKFIEKNKKIFKYDNIFQEKCIY